MPQTSSTSFMEMLVFSLFNYGSASRDAFLLLQLFTEALRYEIRCSGTTFWQVKGQTFWLTFDLSNKVRSGGRLTASVVVSV